MAVHQCKNENTVEGNLSQTMKKILPGILKMGCYTQFIWLKLMYSIKY